MVECMAPSKSLVAVHGYYYCWPLLVGCSFVPSISRKINFILNLNGFPER